MVAIIDPLVEQLVGVLGARGIVTVVCSIVLFSSVV